MKNIYIVYLFRYNKLDEIFYNYDVYSVSSIPKAIDLIKSIIELNGGFNVTVKDLNHIASDDYHYLIDYEWVDIKGRIIKARLETLKRNVINYYSTDKQMSKIIDLENIDAR